MFQKIFILCAFLAVASCLDFCGKGHFEFDTSDNKTKEITHLLPESVYVDKYTFNITVAQSKDLKCADSKTGKVGKAFVHVKDKDVVRLMVVNVVSTAASNSFPENNDNIMNKRVALKKCCSKKEAYYIGNEKCKPFMTNDNNEVRFNVENKVEDASIPWEEVKGSIERYNVSGKEFDIIDGTIRFNTKEDKHVIFKEGSGDWCIQNDLYVNYFTILASDPTIKCEKTKDKECKIPRCGEKIKTIPDNEKSMITLVEPLLVKSTSKADIDEAFKSNEDLSTHETTIKCSDMDVFDKDDWEIKNDGKLHIKSKKITRKIDAYCLKRDDDKTKVHYCHNKAATIGFTFFTLLMSVIVAFKNI